MSLASIAAGWRKEADDMDRSAKNYKRSCIEAKAAELILGAKLLRRCAVEIERHESEQHAMARASMAEVVQDGPLASAKSAAATP